MPLGVLALVVALATLGTFNVIGGGPVGGPQPANVIGGGPVGAAAP